MQIPIKREQDMLKYIKTPAQISEGENFLKDIKLNKYISIPSTVHGYSLAIEYMRDWIVSKFPKDFFKTVYINGKHVLADFRHLNGPKMKQIQRPAIAIVPQINADYNRENIDLIQGGLNIYTRNAARQIDRFFNDIDNNLYIGIRTKQIEMPFGFKIRVQSRAQQLEVLEFTRLACRIGSTQTHFIDIDVHVPYDIMMSLAIDAGFELVEDANGDPHVRDVTSFLHYLNTYSSIPFTYKLRTINGHCEYFVRLKHCHTHIACLDGISIDDGDRDNMLETNFHIEFTATLLFTVPQLFSYHSMAEHRIQNRELDGALGMYQIISVKPPEVNEKGWHQYLTTQWIDKSKHLGNIDFTELIQAENLMKVINYNNKMGLSSEMFMDIIAYNGQKEVPIIIDWDENKIRINEDVREDVTDIAIYTDTGYINEVLINLENLNGSRIKVNPDQNK